jgi:hypothetical protein
VRQIDPAAYFFTLPALHSQQNQRLMNPSPEKNPAAPLRMTASEFVTALSWHEIATLIREEILRPYRPHSPRYRFSGLAGGL